MLNTTLDVTNIECAVGESVIMGRRPRQRQGAADLIYIAGG